MKVFFFISFMFGSILSTVVSDYFVSIDLLQFSNGAGYLDDGTHCDSFWFAGRLCNIRLKICIENIKEATPGTDTCSTVFIDLGQVTTNQNSITFSTNTWYGAWLNPSPFHFVDNAFEGIQVKLIAQHTGFNDYPLIDKFVWPIRDTSQSGVASINHTRPNAPDPTFFQLAWTVGGNVPPPPTTTSGPPTTSTTATPLPRDCYDVLQGGNLDVGGVFNISLPNGEIVEVYCALQQGGWTVIQNRADITSFDVSYDMYQKYFGNAALTASYWLGLDNIYSLVNNDAYSLKIELCCGSSSKSSTYDSFKIGDSGTKYMVNVSAADSNSAGGDGFNNETSFGVIDNGAAFSTSQNYSGLFPQAACNTLAGGYGGWWFGSCQNNLNGFLYINGSASYAPPVDRCVLVPNPPNGAGVAWTGIITTWTKARMMIIKHSHKPAFNLELEQKQTADYCSA